MEPRFKPLMLRLAPGLRRTIRRVVGTAVRRLHQLSRRYRIFAPANRAATAAAWAGGIREPSDAVSGHGELRRGVVFVSGEPHTPGHRYRVERHARAAADIGFRATVLDLDQVSSAPGVLEQDVAFVVLWRLPWSRRVRRVMERARRHGAVVIFDVDDLMTVASFATVDVIDGIRTQNADPSETADLFSLMRRTARAADACCCTTESLAGWLRMEGLTTFVLPNGFANHTLIHSRTVACTRRRMRNDQLIRIGYAAGSFTHQEDLRVAVPSLARLLREQPRCRLVLFEPCTDISEFPQLAGLEEQIEWRQLVPLEQLPSELARFDINIAPLQMSSPFCDAKSALKYFEAALVDVPTIASPTAPYRDAIAHASTGLLARTDAEWYQALTSLVNDPDYRRRLALNAYVDALWRCGPALRSQRVRQIYRQLGRDRQAAAESFQLAHIRTGHTTGVQFPSGYERVFDETHPGAEADVTVIVPLRNYADLVQEALESVAGQTLASLDLIIIDDASTDTSLQRAATWARSHRPRFRRIAVLSLDVNAGVAAARNVGFFESCTPYVLPLDADNVLKAECCQQLLAAIGRTGASFAFPRIREFGGSGQGHQRGFLPYRPQRFVGSNYIDAMALISLEAWAAAGGYAAGLLGWEDYDLWCGVAEKGLYGTHVDAELALYRNHAQSMTRQNAARDGMKEAIERRHPWVHVHPVLPADDAKEPRMAADRIPGATAVLTRLTRATQLARRQMPSGMGSDCRLNAVLELLRCPRDLGRLTSSPTGLTCARCAQCWPVVDGRPILFERLPELRSAADGHLSNPIPQRGEAMIDAASGWVLNLSAGGTPRRRAHVIELEASIFYHTDVVADAHRLPFDDGTFEAVLALNCFEHFHSPVVAAAEIQRVLRPGGALLVHTAFMQPLHEAPTHFYNTTSFGLRQWFGSFDVEQIAVTDNFNPMYSLSWTAAEILECLRRDVSEPSAEQLAAATLAEVAGYWLDPARRGDARWAPISSLSSASLERTAAGFELVARSPLTSDRR